MMVPLLASKLDQGQGKNIIDAERWPLGAGGGARKNPELSGWIAYKAFSRLQSIGKIKRLDS